MWDTIWDLRLEKDREVTQSSLIGSLGNKFFAGDVLEQEMVNLGVVATEVDKEDYDSVKGENTLEIVDIAKKRESDNYSNIKEAETIYLIDLNELSEDKILPMSYRVSKTIYGREIIICFIAMDNETLQREYRKTPEEKLRWYTRMSSGGAAVKSMLQSTALVIREAPWTLVMNRQLVGMVKRLGSLESCDRVRIQSTMRPKGNHKDKIIVVNTVFFDTPLSKNKGKETVVKLEKTLGSILSAKEITDEIEWLITKATELWGDLKGVQIWHGEDIVAEARIAEDWYSREIVSEFTRRGYRFKANVSECK